MRLSCKHKLKRLFAISSLIALICIPSLSIHSNAMNFNGFSNNVDNYYNNNSDSASTCKVTINAYCPSNTTFLSEIPLKIKDSSGNFLYFSSSYSGNDKYVVSPNGSQTLITNSNGEINVELPSGYYYIVMEDTSMYTPTIYQMQFYIENSITSKNIDVDYLTSSGSLSIDFYQNNEPIYNCAIQISDAFGNLMNFFSIDHETYSYVSNTGKTTLNVESSNIEITNLPEGKYFITVVSAPNNLSPESDAYTTNIINGSNQIVNILFSEQQGSLAISNIDAENKILTGSACSVVGPDNTILTFTKVGESEYRYDVNGIVNNLSFDTTEPILVTGLAVGSEYTVNEVNTSTGYVLADPQKITLDSISTGTVILKTKKTTGALTIKITDYVTNEPIADVSYSISTVDGTPLYFSLKDAAVPNSSYIYNSQGEITAVTSGTIGVVNIEGLPAGDIILKCKECPSGYVIDTEPLTKTILPNKTDTCEITLNKSNVAIEVLDENESPLIDVGIEIYNSNGELLLSGQTNAKGKILLSNVIPGEYTYRVSSVPEKYAYTEEIKTFTITSLGTAEGLDPITLEKTRIKVSIGKQIDNNGLENAIFVLYDTNGNEIHRALTSTSGIATFSGIGYGDYIIKQISAPIGYTVSSNELKISIDNKYINEDVFDFSGDSIEESSSQNHDTSSSANSSNNTSNSKSALSIGDLFFIIIGILVIAFVIISIISFVLKLKEKEKSNGIQDIEDSNSTPAPLGPIVPAKPIIMEYDKETSLRPDEEEIKIFVPSNSSPNLLKDSDDIDLSAKSQEELQMMEKKIRELINKNAESKEDIPNE